MRLQFCPGPAHSSLQQQFEGVVQLAEGQDVYQLLAPPYQDLWLHWLDEGNEAYKQQAQNSNQERLDFVRSLVAAAAAAGKAAASQNGDAEPMNGAAVDEQQQAPKVINCRHRLCQIMGHIRSRDASDCSIVSCLI